MFKETVFFVKANGTLAIDQRRSATGISPRVMLLYSMETFVLKDGTIRSESVTALHLKNSWIEYLSILNIF